MIQFQISLPESVGEFIQQQIAAGHYRSADEFVTQLVEQVRALAVDERLAELIREGMESGEGVEVTDEWWDQVEERARVELERRRSA